MLLIRGSAANVGAAFGTSFQWYRAGSHIFYSHSTPASLPGGWPITGVLGLGNATPIRPTAVSSLRAVGAPSAGGCAGTAWGFAPCQIQKAYNASPLIAAGTNGSGYRIGIVDTYDGNEPQPTLAKDFASFTTQFKLPNGSVQYLYPVPTSRNLNATSTGWALEEALDLEWARASAPGASVAMTFAPDAFVGLYASVDWLVSHRAVDVISLSWGEPDVGVFDPITMPCSSACNATSDGSYTLLHPVLAAAAAEGITVFAASGDCGAADGTDGVSTNYPASDEDVVGVGATQLTVGTGGAYSSEVAWSGNSSGKNTSGCFNQGGSGGGYSPFPRPWWQAAPGVPAGLAVRAVPDVAMDGSTASPAAIYFQGSLAGAAGTSLGTPIWAGFTAIADQYAGRDLGLLNPSLYAIGRGAGYSTAFHDITSGGNGYPAGAGWDAVTGLGSPLLSALVVRLVAGPNSVLSFPSGLHATPRTGAVPTTVSFSLAARGGAGAPYPFYDVTFGDGNASLAPGGNVSHTYRHSGVFAATGVVIDRSGNSSVSPPLAIVIGGGRSLTVGLTSNVSTPGVGAVVGFTASVAGGIAPFRFLFSFGDGTYQSASTARTAHSYQFPGSFCASVVVTDNASPPNGGASDQLQEVAGGASAVACASAAPLSLKFTSARTSADLAGDLPFNLTTTGGTAPVRTEIVTDDAYATACQCGIFRTAGTHRVTAYANDSVNRQVTQNLTVTLYPALVGSFSAGPESGPVPLAVTFTATAMGGHLPDLAGANWSFGDGSYGSGPTVTHTYTTPGFYLAVGDVNDSGFGNASEAFLLDVLPTSSPTGPVVTATIVPAVRTEAGTPIHLHATAQGSSGPYVYRWDLGTGDSAFGPYVNESYADEGCLGAGTCPLSVLLTVTDASGSPTTVSLSFGSPIARRESALAITGSVSSSGGPTPLRITAVGSSWGYPGTLAWSFGDGATSPGSPATHTYLLPGNYTVQEVGTDAIGDRLVRSHAVAVTGIPRNQPGVTGSPLPASGFAPLLVDFPVVGSGGAGGPYALAWSFGDGTTGNGTPVSHLYRTPGQYLANVTVTDSLNDSATVPFVINVYSSTLTVLAIWTPGSVAAGTAVPIAIHATVQCGTWSAPTCSSVGLIIEVGWSPVSTGPAPSPPSVGPAITNRYGWANFSAEAPLPGIFHFDASVNVPGYSGFGEAVVTVRPPTPGPWYTAPLAILLTGAGVGGLLVVVTIRRATHYHEVRIPKEPTPSPRPAEPGEPPVG